VLKAESDLRLAEMSLELLVGAERLDTIPDLAPMQGVPPALERSSLDLGLAEIAVRNAERGLIPTAQASYAWNLDSDNSLSISLESRTLQPTIGFQHSSIVGSDPTPVPGPELDASFSIGVGLTIGPELFRTLDATRDRRSAAEARLRADMERLPVTEQMLQNSLDAADRQLALAEMERDLDTDDLADVRARVELGLATELEAEQAALTLAQSELALLSARVERLGRVLDWYTMYAIPISEVSP
jgi:outer membrane protein TolC